MKKTIPILLSAALLLSACGQAAGTAETTSADAPAAVTETTAQTSAPKTTPGGVDKAETVYAKADADGTVTETTVEALCGALGSGGSSLSGRGCCAAGRAATAGCQRQGHDTGHGKAQLLFHNCVLLLLLVFARCSNNSQGCAIMLRICFTILRIQDFCAGVNAHN